MIFNLTGTGGTNASSAIFTRGPFTDSTIGSRNARSLSNSGEVTATLTGTAATMEMRATGSNQQPVAVSVDGGSFTLIDALTLNTWTTVTLFTGLSDAAHTVVIKEQGTSSTILGFAFDKDSVFNVTGGSPACVAPSGYETKTVIRDVIGTYIKAEGEGGNFTLLNYPVTTFSNPDGMFHLAGRVSDFSVFAYGNGTYMCLWVKTGSTWSKQSDVQATNDSKWHHLTLGTGLDTTQDHEYCIHFGGQSCIVYDIMTAGGTGLNTSTIATRDSILGYGDSIAQGAANTATGSTTGSWGPKLAMLLNCFYRNRGLSGSAQHDYGSGSSICTTATGENRISEVIDASPEPGRVFVLFGANDATGSCNGGTPISAAAFKVSERSMIDDLIAGLSSTVKLYRLSCTRATGQTSFNNASNGYNTVIAEAVTESGHSNARFVDTSTTFANVHPTESECTTYAQTIYDAVALLEATPGSFPARRRFRNRALLRM